MYVAEDYTDESDYPTTLVEQLAMAVGREQDKVWLGYAYVSSNFNRLFC